MDFSNLSTETYASFILAIVFTIATFAGGIYLLRHFDCNKAAKVVFTIAFPFCAMLCWLYTILGISGFGVYANLAMSFCLPVAFYLIVLAFYVVSTRNKQVAETESVETISAEGEIAETEVAETVNIEKTENAEEVTEQNIEENTEEND